MKKFEQAVALAAVSIATGLGSLAVEDSIVNHHNQSEQQCLTATPAAAHKACENYVESQGTGELLGVLGYVSLVFGVVMAGVAAGESDLY